MDGMTPHIAGGHKPVVRKLALQGEIPVLNLRRFDVVHGGVIAERNKRSILSELDRERIHTVEAGARRGPWIVEYRIDDACAGAPWRNDRGPEMILCVGIIVPESR